MSEPAVLPRLSGPAELAAALPLLCGFVPAESLVLCCLAPGSARLAVTLRLDLPAPAQERAVARDLAARLRALGTQRAYLLVTTDEPGPRPRQRLVREVARALDVALLDLLLVRAGRWRSYRCRDDGCCPPEGAPLPDASPDLVLVQARAAVEGRSVLPSREALEASLACPPGAGRHRDLLRATEVALEDEARGRGRPALRRRLLQALGRALAAPPDDAGRAELALALADLPVRDEVLAWSLHHAEALFGLLLELARTTPPPYDAPVCACLAWVAYARGDGAAASIALDRALTSDPGHGLARLLRRALDGQVPPTELREVLRRAAGLSGAAG